MIKRSSAHIIRTPRIRQPLSAVAFLLISFLSLPSMAQDSFIDDTVNISAVTVTARASARLEPYTVIRIEPGIISRNEGNDLATLLQRSSLLNVKRYGNHGLASVSIRGMSGSHTLVTWNGLTLNTPGNGYSDFTLIPVLPGSSVRIISGGADMADMTGFLGGKVELESEPLFGSGREASLSFGAGSYGSFSPSASVSIGGDHAFARLSAWADWSRNDFRFVNHDAPQGEVAGRRTNASWNSSGLMGDIAYRKGTSTVTMNLWVNDTDRELPGPVTTVQQDFDERQTDRSFRGVITYSAGYERFTTSVTAGGSHDINRYYHQIPANNGNNISSVAMIRVKAGYRLSSKTYLEVRAGDSYEQAKSLSYEAEEKRNLFSLSLSGKSTPLPGLNIMAQARQVAVTGIRVAPEFTAGVSWMLPHNGEHIIKASVSSNTKIPCLNDLFWIPGGNPDLIPERSRGGEASWSFLRISQTGLRNSLDVVLHVSRASNLIQWVPGQSGIWNAMNVREVNVIGTEFRAGTEQTLHKWLLRGTANYAFTRSVIARSDIANDRSAGRQLIYIPVNHANLTINAVRKWFNTGLTTSWESRRYTASDNSEWLPHIFMTDAFAGIDIRSGKFIWKTEVEVNNLLNNTLESVRNYPMPLRTIKVKITLTLSDKRKSE